MSYKAKVATFLKFIVLAALLPASAPAQDAASERPAVIKAVAPIYYRIIRGTLGEVDFSGEVSVRVDVNESGEVTSVEVISVEALRDHPPLRMAATDAARQWRFTRAEGGGLRTVKLVFSFRTMLRGTPDSELATTFSFADVYRVEVRRWSVEEQAPPPRRSRRRPR